MTIGLVLVGIAVVSFTAANSRTASRRAAQVFARDLATARSAAVRGRENVTIKFYESTRWYTVTTASGRTLATRRFGVNADVALSAIDLALTGDSLVFSNRGVGTFTGSLGTAKFTSGTRTYQVSFNSIGASQVGEL